MMKLITLVPCGYQYDIPNKDIDLILLHKLMDNKEYLEYYKGYEGYKILDNSAFELGEGLDIETLLKYAEDIQAQEIVIPDVYGDKDKTIEKFKNFEKKYIKKGKPFKHSVMVVPQGKNEKELNECLDFFLNKKTVNTIGLNKLFNRNDSNNLMKIISRIKTKGKNIHFLGCNNVLDILMVSLYSKDVRSIDSRIISKFITNDEDVWDCKLTPNQIANIRWLVNNLKMNMARR